MPVHKWCVGARLNQNPAEFRSRSLGTRLSTPDLHTVVPKIKVAMTKIVDEQ